jgi:hypothetical protein
MKGMSIVGTSEAAVLPAQAAVQTHNTRGNHYFNQGQYRDAILEYGLALGISRQYGQG